MSARRVSREPYRIGRSRREVWTAVAVGVAIVLLTVVAVWILAPSDDSPSPVVSTPATIPTDTGATTATTAPATTETTVAGDPATGTSTATTAG